jgi:hypothetical protein
MSSSKVGYLYIMLETLSPSDYIPGHCNIGPKEIKKRFRIGYIGLAGMILFMLLAEVYHIPHVWKLALFAPTVYSLSGFLQARQKFCFLFGFVGVFNIKGKRSKVKDDLQRHKDRNKALWLVTQVVVGSMVITLLYYVLTSS